MKNNSLREKVNRDFEKSKGKTDLRKPGRNWRKSKSKVRIIEKR